jgi:hypothetical protein
MKSGKTKKKQRKAQNDKLKNSPYTLHASSPLLIDIYRVSSLNHPISKGSTNFMHILSPIGNELIKHK